MFIDAVGGEMTGKILDKLNRNSVIYSYGVLSHKRISSINL